jgi:DNA-binding beta-propeller fold protein YncE
MAPPNDFMGPTLWPSDLDVFGFSNPQAVRDLGFDLGSHLDMLHESPLCMGVAFERENVYWTFDGLSSSISRYDFLHDHGPGYDDHSDGVIERYVEGDVQRVPDVPSHLVLDRATNLLYIADTGNARIAILDTSTGRQGPSLAVMEPGTTLTQMIDASLTTLVDRVGGELDRPSGLVLHDGLLFVGDNATSRISAFDLGGVRIDYLDTGLPPGALMGLAFDRQGRMYIADALGDRVLQISDKP